MIIKMLFNRLLILKNIKIKILKFLTNPFQMKKYVVELEDFEALFIMRERTPITRTLIENLPN